MHKYMQYIYVYVYMHICTCMCIYIYMHIHICIYIYMWVHKCMRRTPAAELQMLEPHKGASPSKRLCYSQMFLVRAAVEISRKPMDSLKSVKRGHRIIPMGTPLHPQYSPTFLNTGCSSYRHRITVHPNLLATRFNNQGLLLWTVD